MRTEPPPLLIQWKPPVPVSIPSFVYRCHWCILNSLLGGFISSSAFCMIAKWIYFIYIVEGMASDLFHKKCTFLNSQTIVFVCSNVCAICWLFLLSCLVIVSIIFIHKNLIIYYQFFVYICCFFFVFMKYSLM